jgi:hypothetical protein
MNEDLLEFLLGLLGLLMMLIACILGYFALGGV